MATETVITKRLTFSFNQFLVFDEHVRLPGCAWTDLRCRQGFARRESAVCFATLLEYGVAELTVMQSAYYARRPYQRAVSVPFRVTSGKVLMEAPDENGVNRFVTLPLGHYRLTAAQFLVDDDEETIDLFFEPSAEPLRSSAILIADAELDPPTPLIETSDIAGEDQTKDCDDEAGIPTSDRGVFGQFYVNVAFVALPSGKPIV